MAIIEEIATLDNGAHRVVFGRIVWHDNDRFFIKTDGETAVLRPEEFIPFLAKMNAYIGGEYTLFRQKDKSGISTGKTDATQRVVFQPSEHPPVKGSDVTRGLNQ